MAYTGPLPSSLWEQIAAAAVWTRPELVRRGDGASVAWQEDPRDHPLIALSQTSRSLRRITAPLIWANIALQGRGKHTIANIDRVRKLIVCLSPGGIHASPARSYLRTLDINIDLNPDRLDFMTFDCFQGPSSAPTYRDLLVLMDRLGQALSGTSLRNLRFLGSSNHPTDGFLRAIGRGCPQLEHVELAYGFDFLPATREMDGAGPSVPDPLHALWQVKSASIGLGDSVNPDAIRLLDTPSVCNIVADAPHLFLWLRGELGPGAPPEADNKLVYLKTSASFLYRYQNLVPAWARFNRILEKNDKENEDIEDTFAEGEMVPLESEPEGEDYEEEISWVRAAAALRPSLDLLAQNKPNMGAQDVINMIATQPVFAPWYQAWFDPDRVEPESRWEKEDLPPVVEGPALAEDILHHWRKSAHSRLEAPSPPERWLTAWSFM
ncbi:hypothetical protein OC842_006319 [Tilletia horrida]|uniref:Uncharacterized protein n=1 Tax=Tilletia horrida TaxID=155126 RepID=A0AAN6G652_9BASI|nr:hypothetical protein OC842_006319 [Tilletia horrida]